MLPHAVAFQNYYCPLPTMSRLLGYIVPKPLEITATKAMIYRIAMVTLLALIWPLVIYWIAKDSWRGL